MTAAKLWEAMDARRQWMTNGEVRDLGPDYRVQLDALQLCLRLMGVLR